MSDPKRWLEEGGGATLEERELVEAGQSVRMPSALRSRVWAGVAAGTAGAGAAAEAAAGALPKTGAAKGVLASLSGPAAKGVLAVALLGGAGVGVATLRSSKPAVAPSSVVAPAEGVAAHPAPEEPRLPSASTLGEVSASGSASASGDDRPGASAPTAGKPRGATGPRSTSRSAAAAPSPEPETEARPTDTMPEEHTSRLREESAAVLAIRQTLVAGDAREALRLLDRARAEFPDGALAQEREALTVRALVESGQKDAARKRGEAFLRAFPRSPHAAEVRALLGS